MNEDTAHEVKDALTLRDMAGLKSSIDGLTTAMEKGFAGMHQRQDMTNGKVLKAGNDIVNETNERKLADEKLNSRFEYNRIIWYLFTVAMMTIVALGSYILYHHTP